MAIDKILNMIKLQISTLIYEFKDGDRASC